MIDIKRNLLFSKGLYLMKTKLVIENIESEANMARRGMDKKRIMKNGSRKSLRMMISWM